MISGLEEWLLFAIISCISPPGLVSRAIGNGMDGLVRETTELENSVQSWQ